MNKRRITLNLDEDLVAALSTLAAPSLSAAANEVLREGVELRAHQAAVLRWMDELDAQYGSVTPEEASRIENLLNEPFGDSQDRSAGAA
jgi:predicted transcriptional regulator